MVFSGSARFCLPACETCLKIVGQLIKYKFLRVGMVLGTGRFSVPILVMTN